jgi:hypothetical protein
MDDTTGLVHFICRAVIAAVTLSPIGRPVGCRGLMGSGLLRLGVRLRLRLIWDEFYHHAPQDTAPGYVW